MSAVTLLIRNLRIHSVFSSMRTVERHIPLASVKYIDFDVSNTAYCIKHLDGTETRYIGDKQADIQKLRDDLYEHVTRTGTVVEID